MRGRQAIRLLCGRRRCRAQTANCGYERDAVGSRIAMPPESPPPETREWRADAAETRRSHKITDSPQGRPQVDAPLEYPYCSQPLHADGIVSVVETRRSSCRR